MMNERLPLHVLPTFAIAARLENLRATAQQVHLTHGAVSQQIQLLEQAVGYPLFERRSHSGCEVPSVVAGNAHCSAVPCRLNGARRRCATPQ